MTQRDSDLLLHIIQYCQKAESYLSRCEYVWNTLTEDLPVLQQTCQVMLKPSEEKQQTGDQQKK